MNKSPENEEARLRVSLVIPVRDESATVEALLASIEAQTFQPDEVLFVDGGSADDTVRKLRAAGDAHMRVVEAGDATPGRGRNVGIAAARNEWVALTDAGIRLEPTWLARLVETVEDDPSLDVVYGNYEPLTRSFFERCAVLLYTHRKEHRTGGWMRGPFIASTLLRRRVWEGVGGFPDLRATEDLIFMEQVEKLGFKIGWSPEATVWWQPPRTLRATFRRFSVFSRHNVWAGRQRHWHYGVARIYLVNLLFVALAFAHSWWWLCVPLLITAARVAKSIWQRRENRGLAWLLNPARFLTVGVVLAVIDLATFVGWAQALLSRRPQSAALESTPRS